MRKIFSLLAAVLFAGSMMADNFAVVSSVSDLANGDQIIITGADTLAAISTTQNNNNRGVAAVSATDGVVVPGADVQIITLVADGGNFMLQVGEDAYLYAASNSSNHLKTANAATVGDNGKFAITMDANGVASVVAQGSNARNDLRYNPGSSCFSCYASSTSVEAGLRILKKQGGEVPPTPSVATPVISGEAEFTDSVIVTITCSTPETDIYYTTDGTTDPKCDCAAAPEYTHEIVLKETTTIMAAAYTGNDWSAVATKTFTKVVPPVNLGEKTIAEFLTLKNVKDTCILTGVVDSIKNTQYGNLYLSDATGQVYVYGVLNAAGQSKKFAELGVDVNDTLTIKAIYSEFNNAPQVKNAIFVSVKKAQSVVPQADSILFEGEHAVTWDTPLNLEAAKFAQAKAGQKIVVTYKDATDAIEFKVLDVWCHIAGSREAAYLDQAEGSHTYEQFLTANAVDSIKAHGLQIIGNHFTITKVELLDGKELKEGATIWTGFFWADDWKTLEICHESFNYVDFSKYDVLRIYSEANRSDFVINIKENWEEGGQIASQTDMVAGEGYMELPLTDTLRTRLANAHHLMFQFNKEAGAAFNVTDIVLANYPAVPVQYEVAEAIAAGLKENDEVLVRGIITKMEFKGTNFAKYGSVNIYVADATGVAGEFEFFNCYSLEADTFRTSTPAYDPQSSSWAQFTEVMDGNGVAIHVGDTVIARGKYKLYNSTHELNTGCYLVDIKHASVAPVADTVEVSLSEGLRYDDYVAEEGWWQIYGGDDKFVVSISNISTTQAEGTYTVADLDADYTYLGVIEGKDTTEVSFVSGSVTLSTNAEAGSVTVEGTLIGNDGKAYHLNLLYVAPQAKDTVVLNIPEAALIDYYAAYGLYGVYGTNVEKDHQVYIALWAEDGFQGDFTEADLDMKYIGSGVIDKDGIKEIYTASITVTPGNGGDYNITADLLCYNNTLYKVTMYVPAAQAIDEVDAAQKALKMIKGGQLIIEKNGMKYNVLGTRL